MTDAENTPPVPAELPPAPTPAPAPEPEALQPTAAPPAPAPDLEAKPYDVPVAEAATPAPAAPPPAAPQTSTPITPEEIVETSSDITGIVDAITDEKNEHAVSDTSPNNAPAHAADNSARSVAARAKSVQTRLAKRDAKLARIIEFARNRGSVRNDDIKRILRVSDATATRYARLLVQRGDLVQRGKGRNVSYTPRS